jgi:SAM-dependent methyltransferase
MSGSNPADDTPEDFAERVVASALGWVETMAQHLGLELGWYAALADDAHTAASLAASTATNSRYAREWLEQQTVSGILTVDDAGAASEDRRYRLPPDHAEVLLDGASLSYSGPIATMFAASAARLPDIVSAYRTGGGVSWERLGVLARTSQAALNRPWFDTLAQHAWLSEVLSRPGARIADIGTGAGWSALALARAYPDARVTGVDIDDPSIAMARDNARNAGLDERVTFVRDDAARLTEYGPFDAAFAFESLHDMPDPVAVLAAMRQAAPSGAVIVMDEAVEERFAPHAGSLERLMYGYSLFVCLPDGMSQPDSAATGTVMRPAMLDEYARRAGFSGAEVLEEEFGFWRLYRLH